MTLREKVEGARAKPNWDQKESLEEFLHRELDRVKAQFTGTAWSEDTKDDLLKELKAELASVFARGGIDPATVIIQADLTPEGLTVGFQMADIRQQREQRERDASSGNIVEAFKGFMEACKTVQRSAALLQPLIAQLEDSPRKARVEHLLESQININDRAAMATGELLLMLIETKN